MTQANPHNCYVLMVACQSIIKTNYNVYILFNLFTSVCCVK